MSSDYYTGTVMESNRISVVPAVVLSSSVVFVVPLKSEVQDCVFLTVRESSQVSIKKREKGQSKKPL